MLKDEVLQHLAAIAMFLILAIMYTFPLIANLDRLFIEGDPYAQFYYLVDVGKKLSTDPLDMFNTPIFYPYPRALARHDHMFGIAIFHLPLIWITGSPVTAYNLLFISVFVVAGYGTFLLCRYAFALSFWPCVLGGIIFGYGHFRLDQINHLNIMWSQWLPYCVLFLILPLKRQRWHYFFLFGLFFLLEALSSFYVTLFLCALLGIVWIFTAPSLNRKNFSLYLKIAATLVLCAAIILPFVLQYISGYGKLDLERETYDVYRYSANLFSLIAPSSENDAPLIKELKIFRQVEGGISIGFGAMLLASIGGIVLLSRSNRDNSPPIQLIRALNWALLLYTVVAAASIVSSIILEESAPFFKTINNIIFTFTALPLLAVTRLWINGRNKAIMQKAMYSMIAAIILSLAMIFGPVVKVGNAVIGNAPAFYLLMLFPFLSNFRVFSRWIVPAILAASVLAAFGLSKIQEKAAGRRALIAVLLPMVVICYEYWPVPIQFTKFDNHDSQVYRWLARQEGDFAVMEYPTPHEFKKESQFMMAQLIHGKKIINGYSAPIPRIREPLKYVKQFPDEVSINHLRGYPFRYLIVHQDRLETDRQERLGALIQMNHSLLKQAESFGAIRVLELDKGGRGAYQRLIFPPGETEVSFEISALGQLPGRTQHVEFLVNGILVNEFELRPTPETIEMNISEFTSKHSVTEFEFSYKYRINEKARRKRKNKLPFDLEVESGNKDDHHCVVYLNGRFLPRAKGYNFYTISEDGELVGHQNFNTSWYEKESEKLIKYLENLSIEHTYLLAVVQFDAARSLTQEASNALTKIGFRKDVLGKPMAKHIGMIRIPDNKVIFEKRDKGAVKHRIGRYFDNIGFSVDRFSTSLVPASKLCRTD